MDHILVRDYEELSSIAANRICEQVKVKSDSILGLATGSTPLGTYECLIKHYIKKKVSFRQLYTLNLDEYVGLSPDHPQSYRYFMNKQLFSNIDILDEQTFIPDGTAPDLQAECVKYERIIDEVGPPDLQILGIGTNGHIGFNEPGSSFESETHVTTLTESTRESNKRFFSTKEEVPTQAITMGIRSIMKSKQILLLASGEEKADAIYRLLTGDIDESFPASVLQHHPQVLLIVDQDAYSRMKEERHDA